MLKLPRELPAGEAVVILGDGVSAAQHAEVAGTIAYLCSEDASYVSGQVIYVRGGP